MTLPANGPFASCKKDTEISSGESDEKNFCFACPLPAVH
jgi:hypothetical protein